MSHVLKQASAPSATSSSGESSDLSERNSNADEATISANATATIHHLRSTTPSERR